jgi:hypothetical protein
LDFLQEPLFGMVGYFQAAAKNQLWFGPVKLERQL